MRSLPFGETVTILRPGPATRDRYGNDIAGPDTATDVAGCAVAPRGSTEIVQGRDQVIVGLTAYLPAGTDVQATDRMRVRGVVYQVDGEPGAYRSPLTGSDGPIQVALTRYTG